MKKAYKVISLVLASMFCLITISCADLGDGSGVVYEDSNGLKQVDYTTYYSLFDDGECCMISQDIDSALISTTAYSIEDSLFNDYVSRYLKCSDQTKDVEYNEYLYLYTQFTRNVYISEFALYFKSQDSYNYGSLDIYIFVVGKDVFESKSKFKAYNSPSQEEDGEGGYKDIQYDDMDVINAIKHTSVSLSSNATALYINSWDNTESTSGFTANKDDYFVMWFRSNSGYGKDDSTKPLSFNVVNMMIYSKDIGDSNV